MSSPASVAKHPIHPMLVAFPIGLLVFSLICDLVFKFGTQSPIWSEVALYTMGGGIIGGLLAALPGLVDLLSIHDPKTKSIGLKHLAANLTGLILFAAAFWVHYRAGATTDTSLSLSVLGALALSVGGWLGGELVYARGVAVDLDPDAAAQTVPMAAAEPSAHEPKFRKAS